jgi:hypothetical protein
MMARLSAFECLPGEKLLQEANAHTQTLKNKPTGLFIKKF